MTHRRHHPLLALLVAIGLAGLYLLSVPISSDAQILGNDAFAYAKTLARGDLGEVLDPHHLGHHLLAYAVLKTREAVGAAGLPLLEDGLRALRLVSAFGGGLCAAIVGSYAARLACGRTGLWIGAAFAFSAGPWLYSAVGETYLPAAAASAWLLGSMLEARAEGRSPGVAKTAALLLLCCLLRQDSVLLVPAVLILLGPGPGIAATGIAGGLSVLVYLLAWTQAGAGLEFLPWLRGLADAGLWGDGFTLERLWVSLVTQQHALHYGVRFGGGWTILSLVVTALLVGAAFAAGGPARRTGLRVGLLALLVTVLVRLGFFTWWQPSNMEYHTPTLVPLLLGLALVAGRSTRPAPLVSLGLGGLAALSLLLGNAGCLIEPNRESTLHDDAVEAFERTAPEGLVVVLDPFAGYAAELARPASRTLIQAGRTGIELDHQGILSAIVARLEEDQRVALLRDIDLFPRLQLGLLPIDTRLQAGIGALPVSAERFDRGGQTWLMILEADR